MSSYTLNKTDQQLILSVPSPGFRGGAGWRLAMGLALFFAGLVTGSFWLQSLPAGAASSNDLNLTGFIFAGIILLGAWTCYLAYTHAKTQTQLEIDAKRYRLTLTHQRSITVEGQVKQIRYIGLSPPGLRRDLPRIQGIIIFENLNRYSEWGQGLSTDEKDTLSHEILAFLLPLLPPDQAHLLQTASG